MKIDIRKSEKENVRALLFSNNPDLNEKLLSELAFDNYQFNSDGTVDCTITEDDPLMDGYTTEGSVKISYARLDIDKFLTGVLGGKIFPITVNTKEEVIDYLNEKEIMITSTISNVILNKNQEGRLEEIYISIKNDSLCYHGEVRLIPNLPVLTIDNQFKNPIPIEVETISNKEYYKISPFKDSYILNIYEHAKLFYSNQQEAREIFSKNKPVVNKVTQTVDIVTPSAIVRFNQREANINNNLILQDKKRVQTGSSTLPTIFSSSLDTVFLNDIDNEEPVFILEESAINDYRAKHKVHNSGSPYGIFNIFTRLDTDFNEPSLLHIRLLQCGIDPYQVEIKVSATLENDEILGIDYLRKNIGDSDNKIIYNLELRLIEDLDYPIYSSIGNFKVRYVTLLEELLNPYIGGYRSPVFLVDSIHYRREHTSGNASASAVNAYRNNTHVYSIYPLAYFKDKDGVDKLQMVDYNFSYVQTRNGVHTGQNLGVNIARDFMYTYLQELQLAVASGRAYPPTNANAFTNINTKLHDVYRFLTTTNTGTTATNSILKFTLENVEVTSNNHYPLPTAYSRFKGDVNELKRNYTNITDRPNYNVFNYGSHAYNTTLAMSSTGYFKITGKMKIKDSNPLTDDFTGTLDRSGKFEMHMAMPNLAMIFEKFTAIVTGLFTISDRHYTDTTTKKEAIIPDYFTQDDSLNDVLGGQVIPFTMFRSYNLMANENAGQVDIWFKNNGYFRDTKLSITLQHDPKGTVINYLSKFKTSLANNVLERINFVYKIDLADAMSNRENAHPFISNIVPVPVYYIRP